MNDFKSPHSTKAAILRADIESVKIRLKLFYEDIKLSETSYSEDRSEQIDNAMLAFRHLEDAKMRLGKVIQAGEGQSVYDTPPKES
jgi:hypothetical protein